MLAGGERQMQNNSRGKEKIDPGQYISFDTTVRFIKRENCLLALVLAGMICRFRHDVASCPSYPAGNPCTDFMGHWYQR